VLETRVVQASQHIPQSAGNGEALGRVSLFTQERPKVHSAVERAD
jgi:hypothetical protein